MTKLENGFTEESMIINSVYYCPNCTGGGDLFVKDTDNYFKHHENVNIYYCKKCKRTFKIEDILE